jgi:RNA recognition motif-containing protein
MDRTYIYAGNMPFDLSEETLRNAFSPFGNVEETKIATSDNGMFMGYAFVRMSSEDEAAKAIQELNGKDIGGRDCFLLPGTDPEAQDMWNNAFGEA